MPDLGSARNAGTSLAMSIEIEVSGAARCISGRQCSAAKARKRWSSAVPSKPGRRRISQPNQHGTGTMLEAVPPAISVTCRLV